MTLFPRLGIVLICGKVFALQLPLGFALEPPAGPGRPTLVSLLRQNAPRQSISLQPKSPVKNCPFTEPSLCSCGPLLSCILLTLRQKHLVTSESFPCAYVPPNCSAPSPHFTVGHMKAQSVALGFVMEAVRHRDKASCSSPLPLLCQFTFLSCEPFCGLWKQSAAVGPGL